MTMTHWFRFLPPKSEIPPPKPTPIYPDTYRFPTRYFPFASKRETVFFDKHDERDGYKVWLSQDEVIQLLEHASDSRHRMAFELGARCGLRSDEIVRVSPSDVTETAAGPMLIVDNAKTDGKRQTPIPTDLRTRLETVEDMRDEPPDAPVIDATTRTLQNWINQTGRDLADSTGEEMWTELTMHDLRRTWATSLKGQDVDAMIVCDWGGWSDLETFLDHYRGKFSPEIQKQQRQKVQWL